jgi:hypothetical protein
MEDQFLNKIVRQYSAENVLLFLRYIKKKGLDNGTITAEALNGKVAKSRMVSLYKDLFIQNKALLKHFTSYNVKKKGFLLVAPEKQESGEVDPDPEVEEARKKMNDYANEFEVRKYTNVLLKKRIDWFVIELEKQKKQTAMFENQLKYTTELLQKSTTSAENDAAVFALERNRLESVYLNLKYNKKIKLVEN